MEEIQNGLRPRRGVVAAGVARDPEQSYFFGTGAEISCGEGVETTAGKAELIGSLSGPQRALSEGFEHIADKRRCMTVAELLVIFRAGRIPCRRLPRASLFVGHRYARPPQRLALGTKVVLLC